MKNTTIIFLLIVCVVVLALFVHFTPGVLFNTENTPDTDSGTGVVCTLEAKLCPDGSYVGRSGPNCEFAACPSGVGATSTSSVYNLNTTYVHTVDWPPMVSIDPAPFTCTEAGLETARAGQTTKKTISGRAYCVTKESEGAAGSIYTNYAYAFANTTPGKTNETVILTFSLRAPQCLNYDEPQRSACTNEQAHFSVDDTVEGIVKSLGF